MATSVSADTKETADHHGDDAGPSIAHAIEFDVADDEDSLWQTVLCEDLIADDSLDVLIMDMRGGVSDADSDWESSDDALVAATDSYAEDSDEANSDSDEAAQFDSDEPSSAATTARASPPGNESIQVPAVVQATAHGLDVVEDALDAVAKRSYGDDEGAIQVERKQAKRAKVEE
ncbi:hypothetical protein GGF31_008116 [Allomyces arbusculus]|nr:hypothetical protein GGF31_008116 [Allomyces arbusculus]